MLKVLHHFAACYAGQTTQGNTDDAGDGGDPDSGSNPNPKKVTGLLQGADSLRRTRNLQKTKASDQRSAFSSVDSQPKKRRKGGNWLRNIFKPSTSYDPPQSDKMPFPVHVRKSEAESYNQNWKPGQYNAFIEEEDRYFRSEYSSKKILKQDSFGTVSLATRNSNGAEVAYKSIPKTKVDEYTLESTPLSICHLRNPLVGSDEQSVAQCMSSRPPNLLVPHEFLLQMYLSRPGHGSPYVPMTLDHIILEDEFIVVMEYLGGKWVTLAKYVEEKGRLGIEEARNIVREIVNGMISLKQCGIVHRDLNAGNVMYNPRTSEVKLIDFGVIEILPGWEKGKPFLLKFSSSLSRVLGYKAGYDELQSMRMLGRLLYRAMTGNDVQLDDFNYREFMREAIPDESDSSRTLLLSTSIAHLVVECEQVAGHRIQSGLVPAIQKSRLRLLGRALDPGVENVYTWLRGGVLNGETDLDQRWLDGTVEHKSMGARHDSRALGSTG
ncbi:hypothetical protein BASA50_010879 [Batrachochytrium salamandrivorans]|uniref:non-specific serine/threonine protein kinase n=1 Tax=Batrachochytrium salamandrivorans TaxID=1357716 RepID=A0ABQ8EX73_9FUNG|nr:hypothetical protein BASA50_010879 [Batrachochytrium salamandrivorans]KAH9264507.1 hypothetical protein BASA83_012040 [Batrachochytrium salamandrivorans]